MERSYKENITTKLKINNFETRHHLHRIFVFANSLVRKMVCVPNFVYVKHTHKTTDNEEKGIKKQQVMVTGE